MKTSKLLALDIDGTLLTNDHKISSATRDAILKARAAGAEIVLSTGRGYSILPFDLLSGLDIRYAITANGAAVYDLYEQKCLFENSMELELALPLLTHLEKCDIMIHLFTNGKCYHTEAKHRIIEKMDISEHKKTLLHSIGTSVENLTEFSVKLGMPIQKISLRFYPLEDGTYKHHDELETYLRRNPSLSTVCGGDTSLEVTKAGVNKGIGLRFLSDYLQIPIEHTIACGDSENDLDIIKAAGLGVAMGNASSLLKKAADFVTLPNNEDGVAHLISKFILS